MTVWGDCVDCGRRSDLKARGMCNACYQRAWYHRRLDRYALAAGTPTVRPRYAGNPWYRPENPWCPGCAQNRGVLPYDPCRDDTWWHCVDCGLFYRLLPSERRRLRL